MNKKIHVWTYWHSQELPERVNECIGSWKRYLNPDKFKIVILSEENVRDFLPPGWLEPIPDFQDLHLGGQADFIRLSLLKFYGGVWLDASIYLYQDISYIESFERFYAPKLPWLDHSNVQTWFLVAPRDNEVINKWLSLYIEVLCKRKQLRIPWYHLSMYCGIGLNGLILLDRKFTTYFKVYEVFADIYRKDEDFRKIIPRKGTYGVQATWRLDNFLKIWKGICLYALSKPFEKLSSSPDPLNLKKAAMQIWVKEQLPSLTLKRNGKVILCKLNAADRNLLPADFRFESADPTG